MNAVFADTSYYVALLLKSDSRHERAVNLTGQRDARALDVLAAAYAAAGDFDRAQDLAANALRLLPAEPLAAEIRQRLDLYRQRRPYIAPNPVTKR